MSCRRALRRHPVDRAALPHPAQQVDILPGQQVQLADKAARIHRRDGRGGHVGRFRPDNLHRTPVDHNQIDVFITRPEQYIAPMSLVRRTVGQEPREQLIAQPRRCNTGRHQRFAQVPACVAGAQPIQIMRCGPGHRTCQAGLTEHQGS